MKVCGECGQEPGQSDGLCRNCRIRRLGVGWRKYHWTPELVEILRRTYCGKRPAVGAGAEKLAKRTGWPKWIISAEAARRGWARKHRRWGQEEDRFLMGHLGSWSSRRIAAAVRRTRFAVHARARELGASVRVTDGYTLKDLQQAFGESVHVVRRWHLAGLLGEPSGNGAGLRIPEENVVKFIRRHGAEYDLRRVDQVWFKGMIFGGRAGR